MADDMHTIWSHTLELLREQLSPRLFGQWIEPLRLKPGGAPGDQLTLLVATPFTAERVRTKFGPMLEESLSEAAGRAMRVAVHVDPNAPPPTVAAAQGAGEETPPAARMGRRHPANAPESNGLDPRYTFDSFVVGGCNQFVHAAARAVAEAPAAAYNPLFIYGGVGLGKTHIMQAIGNYLLAREPDKRVLYVTSEKFMTQLINSIRYDRMFDFKEQFRSVDMLLVDDVQFIAGKERTQEEFFHLFNALFDARKQIVVSSDQFPNQIEKLEERLRSRFGWGLVADIQPPELETRVAILEKKAASEGVELSEEVSFFLANAIKTNIRELEGAMIRVTAYANLTRKPVTLELAKESLRDLVQNQEKQVTIEAIQKTVSAYYKIRPADMRSSKRSRLFSHPRHVAMYLCKKLTRHSYPEIGHQFGGRDHTTVLHAVRRVEARIKEEPELRDEVSSLSNMLQR